MSGFTPKKQQRILRVYQTLVKCSVCLTLGMVLFLIVRYGPLLRNITVEEILAYTPKSFPLTIFVIWALYAFKSVTVFFPLMVLYVAVGTLFPPFWAFGVNLGGLALCISLPYLLGRWMGRELAEKLLARYVRVRRFIEFGNRNSLLLSFLLRVVNLLPGDLVSLLLGANEMPYWGYLVGSLLGLSPVMVSATLLGRSLADPLSAGFLLPCALLSILLLGLVLLLARRMRQKYGWDEPQP